MEQPKSSPLTTPQPLARLKSRRLIANSIASAVIGLLVWIPTLFAVVRPTCCTWIGIALLHLTLLVAIGAIAGAIGTATVANRTLFFWRGSLSSLIISLLFAALMFVTLFPSIETDTSVFDSVPARLTALLTVVVGGTTAGTITALNFSNRKTQVLRFFDALLVSIVGPLVGGGLAGFVGGFVARLSQGPQGIYGAEPLLVQVQFAVTQGLLLSLVTTIVGSIFGSVYAFIGGIAGQVGDSALMRAIGAAFGTALGLLALIGLLALVSGS